MMPWHYDMAGHQIDYLPNVPVVPPFSVEHALSCAKGGFPSIRHNEIRDLTATLLTEVCHDVCIEPELQPVTNEVLTGSTANSQAGARLDIAANGVWGGTFEKTYFDVRVFNPHAPQTGIPIHNQSTESTNKSRSVHMNNG